MDLITVKELFRQREDYFGKTVFDTIIPRTVKLSEAPSYGLPIIAYDRASRGAEAYRALAREFIQRNG